MDYKSFFLIQSIHSVTHPIGFTHTVLIHQFFFNLKDGLMPKLQIKLKILILKSVSTSL